MGQEVKLTIVNNTGTTVTCTDIRCEKFEDLNVGDQLASGFSATYIALTNDRVFCTFAQNPPGSGSWQLAMTNPEMTDNSACGSLNAGLQPYSPSGTPAQFTFILGQPNEADWDNPSVNKNKTITYGDCS